MFRTYISTSLVCGLLALSAGSQAATLKATYTFDNSLNAREANTGALTATNPLGTSGFASDTVFGNARTVYTFNGSASPASQQAGLAFGNGSGIVSPTSYSLALAFELSSVSGFRRILDVQNRKDDRGLYTDGGHLELAFSGTAAAGNIAANQYQYLILTNDSNTVTAYLNGAKQFSLADSQLNLNNANNPNQLINLFLDNTVGAGQGEYSSGRIALFEAFDGALSASDVATLSANPFANTIGGTTPPPTAATPEPATCSLVAGGLFCAVYGVKRRSKSK